MIPAHDRVLVCPHCGGTKEILSLVSGNTFGATQWSDNKMIAPMLPKASMVQHCPKCGHFYLLSQVKEEREGKNYSFEKGELTWPQMKQALKEARSWEMNPQNTLNLGFTALWCFNDEFYREGKNQAQPTAEDLEYHFGNLDNLLEVVDDTIMRAELLRERHRYKEAVQLLEKSDIPSDGFIASIARGILQRAKEEDPRPFVINDGR